jgi:hypothetical protein
MGQGSEGLDVSAAVALAGRMVEAEIFSGSEQGFETAGLRTAAAELVMVPALGGRVISLRSRRTGREWCWHQPRPDWLWANRAGDNFGGSPQAGIDECVPTVAGCRWRGRAVPDHGEVWYQAWTLDAAERAAGRLTATVRLDVSPLEFSRSIRAERNEFVFDYALRNRGAEAEDFVWCVHPLLTIEAADRLELPEDVTSLRLNGGLGDRPIGHGDLWSYPEPFPGVRLDRLETPGMPRGCVKGFAGPLREGYAALANATTGDRLELRWGARENPLLGLWLNRGHVGFHHVALEPTNGAPDALDEAVTGWRQAGRIAPGGTVRWSLRWRVH